MAFLDISLTGILVYIAFYVFSKWIQPKLMPKFDTAKKGTIRIVEREKKDPLLGEIGVEPMPNSFNWREAETHKYRPFKSVFFMTMGITRTSRSDWLRIDKVYLDDMYLHKQLLDKYSDTLCYSNESPNTTSAVHELYDTVLQTAVQRYPMCFIATGDITANLIRNVDLPRRAAASKLPPRELLKLLAENFQEDFLLLEYDAKQDEYVLKAMTGLAANGFTWANKVNHKLSDVHGPVPMYAEKLQTSMNRYFKNIEPNQFVQRITWGIQTDGGLFKPEGLHLAPGEKPPPPPKVTDLDFDKVYMRTERQVLSRLKESHFLVFSVRTYFEPLANIKADGAGLDMAKQIEAWPESYAQYKSRSRWGEAVLSYLKEPIELRKQEE